MSNETATDNPRVLMIEIDLDWSSFCCACGSAFHGADPGFSAWIREHAPHCDVYTESVTGRAAAHCPSYVPERAKPIPAIWTATSESS